MPFQCTFFNNFTNVSVYDIVWLCEHHDLDLLDEIGAPIDVKSVGELQKSLLTWYQSSNTPYVLETRETKTQEQCFSYLIGIAFLEILNKSQRRVMSDIESRNRILCHSRNIFYFDLGKNCGMLCFNTYV
jgi:hypothetical protein